MDEFERLVETHAGDRETLEMMPLGSARTARATSTNSIASSAFRATAPSGVQARAQICPVCRTPAEGSKLSLATVYGLIDFRRLRASRRVGSGQPVGVSRRRHHGADIPEPLEEVEPTLHGLPLLPAFSSQGLPPMRVSKSRSGMTRYEIVEGPIGMTGSMNIVSGWLNHNSVDRYQTDVDKVGEHLVYLSTPMELMVHDLYVHKSLDFALRPTPHLYSQLPGGPLYPHDGKENGRSAAAGRDARPGRGAAGRDDARDRPLPRDGGDRRKGLGFTLGDFHGFRLKIKYPPIPALVAVPVRTADQEVIAERAHGGGRARRYTNI